MVPSTSRELREANLARALRSLHLADGELTRARLGRKLGVTRATAAALASGLEELGLVTETAAAPTGRRGRPTTRLVPASDGPVVVALEFAVDALRITTVGLGGQLEHITRTPLERQDADHVLEVARAQLHDRLVKLGRRCAGVGIAVHGLVERCSGRVMLAPNLGWEDVALLAHLRLPGEMPVRVENVANLAALAEARRGEGRDLRTMLYIHAAVGLGGALVLDGQPLHGRSGFASEYGHLPFGRERWPCRCGAVGCWETEVDQLALARAAGRDATPATAATVAAAILADAASSDRVAHQALERVSTAFGRGLGALVNAHDPDRIVLAGHARDLHLATPDLIEHAMSEAAMRVHRDELVPVRPSALGTDGALLGAAEALFDHAIARPTILAVHVAT